MKLPKNLNAKWYGEVYCAVPPGTTVRMCEFWDCTEIESQAATVAVFRSVKHAREFCRLNGLVIRNMKPEKERINYAP
jgi:hypothetical protein